MRIFSRSIVLLLVCAGPALARSHGKAWQNVIIDNQTGYWRVFQYWKTPELLTKDGGYVPLRVMYEKERHKSRTDRPILPSRESEKPPEHWYAENFDHSGWSRQTKGYGAGQSNRRSNIYGAGNPTELAFIALRGLFEVKNAKRIKDLVLDLEYHGGIIVYINGKEIAREHLAQGNMPPGSVAEAYPIGAYIKPEFSTCEAVRLRKARVSIKPDMVKKGVNVLAIAVYRAPVRDVLDQTPTGRPAQVKYPIWAHAYVKRAILHSGWGLTPKEAVCSVDEPEPVKREPGEDILNAGSYWRAFTRWKTAELIDEDGAISPLVQQPNRHRALKDCRPLPVYATDPAPDDWAAPDFDDSEWARVGGRIMPGWPFRTTLWHAGNSAALSVVYSRGKFVVNAPKSCKGLRVVVVYHGGVVIHVNGKELARKHMPKGEITPDTLATPYAKWAYIKPSGHLIHLYDTGKMRDHLKQHRQRSFEVDIPADRLRKGINVVGIEVHRCPANWLILTGKYQSTNFRGEPGIWQHAGILDARVLTTKDVTPKESYVRNISRPEGLQLWNSSIVSRIRRNDFASPCETLHPVQIVACRNGWFGGHVAFGITETVEEFEAAVSDLKSKDAAIPASQIEVLYPQSDGESYAWGRSAEFVTLFRDPPKKFEPTRGKYGGAAVRPVHLKVRIPRDQKPGEYSGAITINYKIGIRGINLRAQEPVTVPVKLTVHDFTLPDPKDYVTFMDFIQSPESVALKFNVPQWSEEHWKWMEKSFELLGQIGNKTVYLPLITRTHFGNSESIVRYIRQPDGSHKPDFTICDRYLDLARKYCGKPTATVLYLWEKYTTVPPRSKDYAKMPPLVTELDPRTGKIQEVAVPEFDTPEGKKYWTPVLRAIHAHLAKRGLADTLGIGLMADSNLVRPKGARFFDDIIPGIRWVDHSHGAVGAVKVHGKGRTPIRYLTTVWAAHGPGHPVYSGRQYGWRNETIYCQFSRDLRGDHRSLFSYRTAPEFNICGRQRGMGRFGGDFWNCLKNKRVTDRRHAAGRTLIHRYPDHGGWAQLVVRTSFLGWSPKGAVPSIHFEAIREGVQNCEARIFIEKALLDKDRRAKLGDDLAKRAHDLVTYRTWLMAHCHRNAAWLYDANFHERQHNLYRVAGEVAKKLGGA
jgi:hypothetical protein